MEEMFPKATGREAKIEARKAKSATIHGGKERDRLRRGHVGWAGHGLI